MKQLSLKFKKGYRSPELSRNLDPQPEEVARAMLQSIKMKKLFKNDAPFPDFCGSASLPDPSHNEEINRYMEL